MHDYDMVSGCTLLHLAVRCGSKNVGSNEMALKCTQYLLERDANVYMRDLWTSMMPLHYSAFYDVAAVTEILLGHKTPLGK